MDLDGAVKGEEFRIPVEGGGKNSNALGIAIPANLFRLGICLCAENCDFPVIARRNLLGALITESTKLCRFALAFGQHAPIDGLSGA